MQCETGVGESELNSNICEQSVVYSTLSAGSELNLRFDILPAEVSVQPRDNLRFNGGDRLQNKPTVGKMYQVLKTINLELYSKASAKILSSLLGRVFTGATSLRNGMQRAQIFGVFSQTFASPSGSLPSTLQIQLENTGL